MAVSPERIHEFQEVPQRRRRELGAGACLGRGLGSVHVGPVPRNAHGGAIGEADHELDSTAVEDRKGLLEEGVVPAGDRHPLRQTPKLVQSR